MADKRVELEHSYEHGEVIVREGDEGSEMFIIQEGEVEVSREMGGASVVLATLGRGEFFGEMSLLESEPRSATVRAVGKTTLLVLKRGGLLLKIRRDPTFAVEMLQHMSHRLRYVNQALTGLVEGGGQVPPARLREVVITSLLEKISSDDRR
jgi:CRP/FNR family transcriptional regulator, cyclic AMP receptor protein